ncbi:SDA1 domain-containing protein/NUC130_3NT domain-containing protein [Cephalotus follicularis]|uniref:Protein SDA1 n=1 Tax=Cephalotus follicularis TaxID=3775 RepID=A0A1Q3AVP5_CEPFO|nr:SDA1 domain-containing protein/NUC130_3NT domain-containing protein [Cephalotus follicularis]
MNVSASGRGSGKLSLTDLQSKMKSDPEGYETELTLIYRQFNSAVDLFQQQAALNFNSVTGVSSDPIVAKDLSDRAMFLAHVTPFYPHQLADFPNQLADFLSTTAKLLPSGVRCHVTQALILLINRKIVDIGETLSLFMELQTLGDRNLKKLAFSHVVHSVRRMNQKHKNEAKNRALQNILFSMLQLEDEARAKRSLVTLCELHRRKVWNDDRTANAICMACFHSSSRIMIAAISFLLDYEKIEDDDDDDSDVSSSEDDSTTHKPHVIINRESIYKANHKGTVASKKKKKAKLERAIRSMKRQQRLSSKNSNSNYYSPLNHLNDAQEFAEKLFSRLQSCNERFEVKMLMLKVIARTVGLHRLILLNFYPFLQKYVQPHQRDITNLLAAAVQACHDMVPPEAVEPLFKQIVNQFVHDRSRTEAIAIGLNVIREICLRMPLLMTEDLLQDLVLYKKSHEKAVSTAARSLMVLFREICPSLLVKKDRGRPTDPKARPKAYGEVDVASNVLGFELLRNSNDVDDDADSMGDDDINELAFSVSDEGDDNNNEEAAASDDEENQLSRVESDDIVDEDEDSDNSSGDGSDVSDRDDGEEADKDENSDADVSGGKNSGKVSKAKKRKFSDFEGQLLAADTSLRALKRLAEAKMESESLDTTDGILSNEDFQKIKQLKAEKEANIALSRQGLSRKLDAKSTAFKIPTSDQLSVKRVDPAQLEAHVRRRISKEEKLALVKAGREDREKYQSRIAVKQNKTGGLSNRQKERKKFMPTAAKRSKVAKTRLEKKRKQQRSGNQFRGKKAWK